MVNLKNLCQVNNLNILFFDNLDILNKQFNLDNSYIFSSKINNSILSSQEMKKSSKEKCELLSKELIDKKEISKLEIPKTIKIILFKSIPLIDIKDIYSTPIQDRINYIIKWYNNEVKLNLFLKDHISVYDFINIDFTNININETFDFPKDDKGKIKQFIQLIYIGDVRSGNNPKAPLYKKNQIINYNDQEGRLSSFINQYNTIQVGNIYIQHIKYLVETKTLKLAGPHYSPRISRVILFYYLLDNENAAKEMLKIIYNILFNNENYSSNVKIQNENFWINKSGRFWLLSAKLSFDDFKIYLQEESKNIFNI